MVVCAGGRGVIPVTQLYAARSHATFWSSVFVQGFGQSSCMPSQSSTVLKMPAH